MLSSVGGSVAVGGTEAVGVGVAGQPFKAAFTAATSSVIEMVPLPSRSSAAQADPVPSAPLTARTSSSTVTMLSPLQSPGQAGTASVGVAVGVADGVGAFGVGVGRFVSVTAYTADSLYSGE